MNEKRTAAYQGEGWIARKGYHNDEVRSGSSWAPYSINSEWGKLEKVLLFIPPIDTPPAENVNSIQHLESINYQKLNKQMDDVVNTFNTNEIKSYFINDKHFDYQKDKNHPLYNLIFSRDLFFMTPGGAIVSRMASEVRAGEEKYVTRALSDLGIPILCTINGNGNFEGADALWIRKDKVLIGIGNRTNAEAYKQITLCLSAQNIECLSIKLPQQTQHLLGVVQFVDKDLAVVRNQIVSKNFQIQLQELGFKLIQVQESYSIKPGQAMNFVTISPRSIIMAAGHKSFKQYLENNGIKVCGEVDISELIKGAGGLGCATGILSRSLI